MILNAGALDTLLGHGIAGCKEDLRITENTLAVFGCALRQDCSSCGTSDMVHDWIYAMLYVGLQKLSDIPPWLHPVSTMALCVALLCTCNCQ